MWYLIGIGDILTDTDEYLVSVLRNGRRSSPVGREFRSVGGAAEARAWGKSVKCCRGGTLGREGARIGLLQVLCYL